MEFVFLLVACSGKDDSGGSQIFDADADGYPAAEDCDDADPEVYPTAPEWCDFIDNDCDGEVDENPADAPTWQVDADGDGYGLDDLKKQVQSCSQPKGYTDNGDDCDDSNPDIHPFADELCDGIDNDCDDAVDSPPPKDIGTWWADLDGDGHGDPKSKPISSCDQPKDTVDNDSDCDDTDKAVNPDAYEICNGKDDDCDGRDEYCTLPLAKWASVTITPESAGDGAGWAIGTGRTNGDDHGDLLIGAPEEDTSGPGAGAAYIVEGPITGDMDLGDAAVRYEAANAGHQASVILGGDLDADAVTDIAIGAPGNEVIYIDMGPITAGNYNLFTIGQDTRLVAESAGDAIGGLGSFAMMDTTGDFKDDLAIGAPGAGGGDGAVYFFFGPVTGTVDLKSAYGKYTGSDTEGLGVTVTELADISGAGGDDYVVVGDVAYLVTSAPLGTEPIEDVAAATFSGIDASVATFSSGGDVNGDGQWDLVIGDPSQGPGGGAFVVFGPITGHVDTTKSPLALAGTNKGDLAGTSVTLGDVTGDAVGDVVVGAPGANGTAGGAYVLFGGTELSGAYNLDRVDRHFAGIAAGDAVGTQTLVSRDVNADEVRDLVFASPWVAGGDGAVYIVYSDDL